MKFFAPVGKHVERAQVLQQFRAYEEYLQSVKQQLPLPSFEFASSAWHCDCADHRCPHDSWVESVEITELASGTRQEGSLAISVRLLGALHDGHLLLDYPGVQRYLLDCSTGKGHGTG